MTPDVEALADRVLGLAARSPRVVVGVTGPPGAGKSVLAAAVCAAVVERSVAAVVVPMDGFHLAQAELERLGTADRKGAADTFDAAGYVALLRRLHDPGEGVVYAPAFRREIEEPVAGAIPVPPEAAVVLTEGNYLLLEQGPWRTVRALLDEVWYVDGDQRRRRAQLVDRHVAHGRTRAEAEAWVQRSDEANAELVASTMARADLVVTR